MNSPFANIFLALQQHLQTAVPAIPYIDQDLGQLKNTRPPVSWPCLLIDFEDFNFENLAEQVQTVKGIVVFRLGFAPYSGTSQSTPSAYTQQALGYYDIEWSLHKALQGFNPADDMGSLSRISATTHQRTDNHRVREIKYSIAFEDYSAKRTIQYTPAQIVVTEDLQLPTS